MSNISSEQRQTIFGMSRQLGIHESGNENDELHNMVYSLTGKTSIKELDSMDASRVISRLIQLKDGQGLPRTRARRKETKVVRSGMITPDQERSVWFHMYRLIELDREPSKVSVGHRLCGIIEKEIKITAIEKDPFRFMTFEQGSTLIEKIKKYVQSAKRKTIKQANRV